MCFRCDEKGHSRPQCPYKEFNLMIVQEDGSDREWEELDEEDDGEEVQEVTSIASISLNSMVGISSPRTVKIQGKFSDETVVVMIDSSATDNIISETVVSRLGLTMEQTKGYGVMTGTGLTVSGQGVCRDVELWLEGLLILARFLPLELGSADVILGIEWLESMGDMLCIGSYRS